MTPRGKGYSSHASLDATMRNDYNQFVAEENAEMIPISKNLTTGVEHEPGEDGRWIAQGNAAANAPSGGQPAGGGFCKS